MASLSLLTSYRECSPLLEGIMRLLATVRDWRITFQERPVELFPFVDGGGKSAETRWDTAAATVLAVVGGLGFYLVHHTLQLRPHLPPLSDAARQPARRRGHLLH